MRRVVTNWGKYPKVETEEYQFQYLEELRSILQKEEALIARGNGRCYGDASLSTSVVSTLQHNKILSFDRESGVFHCQAGITLDEILRVIVPRGWFLPVTPGTKFITVGGAVASDVHGKNHHKEGSFSNHILEMNILDENGAIRSCSPTQHEKLFQASCGGMGLTGIITDVKFRLKKIETSYIFQKQIKARNLDEIISLFEENEDWTYSVAWIDCLQKGGKQGRSILLVGEHATLDELNEKQRKAPLVIPTKPKVAVPFELPSITLNQYSIKAFNFLYYHKLLKSPVTGIVDYDVFFYPLDFIQSWNNMYGSNGFVQYQFVLPLETSKMGLSDILDRIHKKGMGSFLAVLKLFGKQDSLISFPMEGYTLALDFPIRKGLFEFLDELDKVVHDLGGRIYLSKDARMQDQMFRKGYPNAQKFLEYIKEFNPHNKFQSLQSKRLAIEV